MHPKGDLRSGELLPVLKRASHDELKLIVEALNRSWDVQIKSDPKYQRAAHNLTIIPEVIADHITRAGGHAFANIVRGGQGPSYAEVLRDVCDVMKVEVRKGTSLLATEEKLLRDVCERVWNAMSPDERRKALGHTRPGLGPAEEHFRKASEDGWAGMPFSSLMAQLAARLIAAVARQLLLAAGGETALTRAVGALFGPVGLAASAIWAAADAFGPSYRGVAPAVFHIASLRQRFLWAENGDDT